MYDKVVFFLLHFLPWEGFLRNMRPFFISKEPTPILNTPKFKEIFGGNHGTLPFDEQGLVRALEMIAFPQTIFKILDRPSKWILKVETQAYPSSLPLFIDLRFGMIVEKKSPEIKQKMPAKKEILKKLKEKVGAVYIWGGNYSPGILKLLHYYPPEKGRQLSRFEKMSWIFQGLDCSGLLYEATKGATMRNTKELLFIGQGMEIASHSICKIIKKVQPLDLIIWKGHVVIVLDEKQVIESHHGKGGVCLTSLELRLKQIIEKDRKSPVNCPEVALKEESFVIRRFIP